jgi:coenzyme F420 hydrogenase subunit beta
VLISIFCAGTPSTQGTKKILERLSVAPEEVAELRYRGRGWPGRTTVTLKQATGSQLIDPGSQFPDPSSQQRRTHNCELRTDNCQLPTDNCELRTDDERSMTYEDSWGTILSKHTQFRCRLCPDSTGELADLSCGDPWYRQIDPEDPGRSLVLVRTELGRSILHGAMEAGYVQLEPAQPDTLPRSQRSLLYRRRQLWGRLAALRAFGVPVPRYRGFSLLGNWRSLPLADKLRSLLGTAHRICTRKWNRPAGSHTP